MSSARLTAATAGGACVLPWLTGVLLAITRFHGEAIRDITDYIVVFYNSIRLLSTFGYLPPNAYELTSAAIQPIAVSESS